MFQVFVDPQQAPYVCTNEKKNDDFGVILLQNMLDASFEVGELCAFRAKRPAGGRACARLSADLAAQLASIPRRRRKSNFDAEVRETVLTLRST